MQVRHLKMAAVVNSNSDSDAENDRNAHDNNFMNVNVQGMVDADVRERL